MKSQLEKKLCSQVLASGLVLLENNVYVMGKDDLFMSYISK